jgi:hypothetical protein
MEEYIYVQLDLTLATTKKKSSLAANYFTLHYITAWQRAVAIKRSHVFFRPRKCKWVQKVDARKGAGISLAAHELAGWESFELFIEGGQKSL